MSQVFKVLGSVFAAVLLLKSGHTQARGTVGDVYIKQDTQWQALKLVSIDNDVPADPTYHAVMYTPSESKPTLQDIKNLTIQLRHAPLSQAVLSEGWRRLGNQEVTELERAGYVDYLKHNDFNKYADVTGQKVDELIASANAKYREAYALSEQKQFSQALDLYHEALDIFPMFIEAVDNIAFILMDHGQFQDAINAFDHSLAISPGATALYYKAQCYAEMREYQTAMYLFQQGMTQFPEKKAAFEEMVNKLNQVLESNRGAAQ
ncbi:tetratricopeptide repeat protein [Pseudoalteromonas rubra]|uniref:tetratricopeptide repeat protein n=1 Tax=Pseudoalteromonas rubra TaxID=43658 RepID=UPI000F7829DD|nr:tetratricopeptide repeat protein [Pseudoalteromonas rubra]